MTITAADVLAPTGEVEASIFYPEYTSGVLTTRLDAYIAAGTAAATAAGLTAGATFDEVVRAFVYYKAWNDVVMRMTSMPASSSVGGEISASFLQSQINQWINERDRRREQYELLVPIALDPNSTAAAPGLTQGIATEIRF